VSNWGRTDTRLTHSALLRFVPIFLRERLELTYRRCVQDSLFTWGDTGRDAEAVRMPQRLRVLITVTAAPNPSAAHGETVCVAGLQVGVESTQWVRLYPMNVRHLGPDARFHKYDIIEVDATPARNDSRVESWRPDIGTFKLVSSQRTSWARRPWVEPVVQPSMCALLDGVAASPSAQSLALVRPTTISGLALKPHPGWNDQEQAKINAYVNQLDLFDDQEKSPLQAPRFKGWYQYRCTEDRCRGHEQGLLDWEFVAFQRRLARMDDAAAKKAIEAKFMGMVCDPGKDTCFFVGNQAKHRNTFSVLGMWYPPATTRVRAP